MLSKAYRVLPALLVFFFLVECSLTYAQQTRRRFREGDEIEYLWVSKWLPGRVLAVDGNAVAIEYEWGGTFKQERVEAGKLRFAWEARALSPMRLWSDESKQFKIRAAVLGFQGDNVQLYKEDGTEISVPIGKLSEVDQRYLEKAKAQAGPPVAPLPPLTEFSQNLGFGFSAAWNLADNLSQLAPDPAPAFAQVPMAGVGFAKAHFFEDLIRVHPIGGSDGWTVAGTVDRMDKLPSRILWASLTSAQIKRVQLVPPAERLTAVDPGTRQILTINPDSDNGPRLTLWTADPTLEQVVGKVSWISSADGRRSSWENWAAIVGPDRVLHEWGKQKFVVWDTTANREVYRIDQESFFSARPTLSPGKRYIALPEDKRVRIIEAVNGKTLASLPVEGGSSAGVAFNTAGNKLAVLTRSQLAVWEFGSSSDPQRYRADAIGTPFSATIEWVDDNSLLVNRETLFDLDLELPVWNYKAKTWEVQKDSYGERTQTVLGGKLCYAVTVGSSSQSAFIVGAVELPGPQVKETIANLDPESLWVIKPGHRVRIEVQCGEFDAQVKNALMRQIEENGWVYDATAATVIKAEMGRSEPQTVTYKPMSGGSSSTQTVTVTPYFSRMELSYNGKVAWQAGGGSGLPGVIFMRPGESAQSQADAQQKPYPGLFSQTDIPEKIFDPTKKNGLGSSLISARGLTPE